MTARIRLGRDIGALLCAKLVLLLALYLLFFSPAPHDAPDTAVHVMGTR